MSKYSKWEAEHLTDIPHPSQCYRDSFLVDNRLRVPGGFFIVSRPHRAEPWWGRDGEVYAQSEAVAELLRENGFVPCADDPQTGRWWERGTLAYPEEEALGLIKPPEVKT